MEVQSLLELTAFKISSLHYGMTPQQIKDKFEIDDPFTEEEAEQIMDEDKWFKKVFSDAV